MKRNADTIIRDYVYFTAPKSIWACMRIGRQDINDSIKDLVEWRIERVLRNHNNPTDYVVRLTILRKVKYKKYFK